MTWTIDFLPKIKKELKCLHKDDVLALFDYLENEIAPLKDPRQAPGTKHLQGNLKDYWRFRLGNIRIIVDIQDEKLIVLVLRIDDRKDVYKKLAKPSKKQNIVSLLDLKKKTTK